MLASSLNALFLNVPRNVPCGTCALSPEPGFINLTNRQPVSQEDNAGDKKPRDEFLTMQGAATYRIIVRGTINPSWESRLSGMSISERRSQDGAIETILVGSLPDQVALSSVLNVLYEMDLPFVSADCLENG